MGPQIVRTRLRDLQIEKLTDGELSRHEVKSVDLRHVPSRAVDGDWLAVARFVLGFADRALASREFLRAPA